MYIKLSDQCISKQFYKLMECLFVSEQVVLLVRVDVRLVIFLNSILSSIDFLKEL